MGRAFRLPEAFIAAATLRLSKSERRAPLTVRPALRQAQDKLTMAVLSDSRKARQDRVRTNPARITSRTKEKRSEGEEDLSGIGR